jgi:hypothetical protein
MASTYRARNGREIGIQADDGEKCYIVHSDLIFALETALKSDREPTASEPAADVVEAVAKAICRAQFAKRQHGSCTLEQRLDYAEKHYWKERIPGSPRRAIRHPRAIGGACGVDAD